MSQYSRSRRISELAGSGVDVQGVCHNGHMQGKFDTEELKRSIREIVKQKDKAGDDALLKGSANQQCKVLIVGSLK
jgi:hypothetical protein